MKQMESSLAPMGKLPRWRLISRALHPFTLYPSPFSFHCIAWGPPRCNETCNESCNDTCNDTCNEMCNATCNQTCNQTAIATTRPHSRTRQRLPPASGRALHGQTSQMPGPPFLNWVAGAARAGEIPQIALGVCDRHGLIALRLASFTVSHTPARHSPLTTARSIDCICQPARGVSQATFALFEHAPRLLSGLSSFFNVVPRPSRV
jgi:hypothetical protein